MNNLKSIEINIERIFNKQLDFKLLFLSCIFSHLLVFYVHKLFFLKMQSQKRTYKRLPDVLSINCHLESNNDMVFWKIQEQVLKDDTL